MKRDVMGKLFLTLFLFVVLSSVVCAATYVCNSGQDIGDVTGDDVINDTDAELVSQIYVGSIPMPENICCGDADKNGVIGVSDVLLIGRISDGLAQSPGTCVFNPPTPGTCGIVPREYCVGAGNYILMALSSETNAHGEIATEENYPHVLCCAFGSGDTTCDADNTPIVKLSSETNAHAQSSAQTGYLNSICYEDLKCESFTDSSCNQEFPMPVLSLSSPTNAHIGAYNDYTTNICCKSNVFAGCTFNSVRWNVEETEEGIGVSLLVTGNDACASQKISFNVIREDGDSSSIISQPIDVTFNGANAVGIWEAENQKSCGFFGTGDCSYYFNATLTNNKLVTSLSEDPEVTVHTLSEDYCAENDIATCEDYTTQEYCESDASVCGVAGESSLSGVDCNDDSTFCGCSWDTTNNKCEFAYNQITTAECGNPQEGCRYGCTLCYNHTTTINYCSVGATCPSGDGATNSLSTYNNNNETCDAGIDGCLSIDCSDGDRDSCSETEGLYCLAGKCGSVEGPPMTLGKCTISQTIEKNCDEEPVGSKKILWSGVWTEGGVTITTIANCGGKLACERCVAGGRSTIPCPAQVQLPFFDYIGIITTVLVIAFIYVSMVLRRKFKKKK